MEFIEISEKTKQWSIDRNLNTANPLKHNLPKSVKERADYFWDMSEDGLTFLGALDYIFMDEKPSDYDTFAPKEWIEKTKEFNEWFHNSPSMAQAEIAIYLLFCNVEEVEDDK